MISRKTINIGTFGYETITFFVHYPAANQKQTKNKILKNVYHSTLINSINLKSCMRFVQVQNLQIMSELSVFLRHAKRNNTKELDLSKRELSFIPKEVFTIRTIEILDLSDNKIITIESAITDLFRIKVLNLINNSIVDLPEEIQSLPKLNILSLKGNPLSKRFQKLLNDLQGEALIEAIHSCFQNGKKSNTPSWLTENNEETKEIKIESKEQEIGWDNSIFKKDINSSTSMTKTTSQGRRAKNSVQVQAENQSKNGVLEIKLPDLEIQEQISMGGFSTIHKGAYAGLEVAIKKVFNPNISEELMKEFTNQIVMLSKYRHPNIVLLIGAVTTPPNLCIVMQLVKEGTLYDLLHRKKVVLSDADKRKIVKQLVTVFIFLHKHGIVHRDIKSHNVLLDKAFNVKLCDFGLARHKSELNTGPMQFCGTPTYMAQELFLKKAYNESVDIFALGTLFYEIYYGEVPYQGLDPADIKQKILKDSSFPSKITVKKPVTEIINKCRSAEPEERPNIFELAKYAEW